MIHGSGSMAQESGSSLQLPLPQRVGVSGRSRAASNTPRGVSGVFLSGVVCKYTCVGKNLTKFLARLKYAVAWTKKKIITQGTDKLEKTISGNTTSAIERGSKQREDWKRSQIQKDTKREKNITRSITSPTRRRYLREGRKPTQRRRKPKKIIQKVSPNVYRIL